MSKKHHFEKKNQQPLIKMPVCNNCVLCTINTSSYKLSLNHCTFKLPKAIATEEILLQ